MIRVFGHFAQWFSIDEKKQRLRCAGHIINLVVKALLFGKGISKFLRELGAVRDADTFKLWRTKGPIGKLHNIVKYINRSDQRRQEFLKDQAAVTPADDEIFEYELVRRRRYPVEFNILYDSKIGRASC